MCSVVSSRVDFIFVPCDGCMLLAKCMSTTMRQAAFKISLVVQLGVCGLGKSVQEICVQGGYDVVSILRHQVVVYATH